MVAAVDAAVAECGDGGQGLLDKFIYMIRMEMMKFTKDFLEQENKTFDEERFHLSFDAALENRAGSRDGVKELREQLSVHKKGKRIPWQDCTIALGMGDVIRYMWRFLGDQDRQRVIRDYKTIFQVYFNSMPYESGAAIIEAVDTGRCSLRGGLTDITEATDGGFLASFHSADEQPLVAEYLINATGFEKNINEFTENVLLRSIVVTSGVAVAHPFGGVACDPVSGQLVWNASRTFPVYGIGHVVAGEKFLTSALSYNAVDALASVSHCVQHFKTH